jgi:dihydroflavonol-4-reductase
VVVSSVAAVGHGPLAEPATEDTAREAERLALAASGPGLEVLAGNPGFVVGPYDHAPRPRRVNPSPKSPLSLENQTSCPS